MLQGELSHTGTAGLPGPSLAYSGLLKMVRGRGVTYLWGDRCQDLSGDSRGRGGQGGSPPSSALPPVRRLRVVGMRAGGRWRPEKELPACKALDMGAPIVFAR